MSQKSVKASGFSVFSGRRRSALLILLSIAAGVLVSEFQKPENDLTYFLLAGGAAFLAWYGLNSKPGKEILPSALFALIMTWKNAVNHNLSLIDGESLAWFALTLFYIRVAVLFLDRILNRPAAKGRDLPGWFWIALPALLLAGWLPHLISTFPGSVTMDARDQLEMALGLAPMSNHNPVFSTLLVGGLFRLGRALFGTDNAGIAMIVAFQSLLMAVAATHIIRQGWKLYPSRFFLALSILFYIVVPIFGGAVQTVVKDSVHAPFFLLMLSCQISLMREPNKKHVIFYCLSLVFVSLTRSYAALYALMDGIGTIAFFFVRKYDLRRFLAAAVSAAMAAAMGWIYLILPAMGVISRPSVDQYSLPFNQIGWVSRVHVLDEEERAALGTVLDPDAVRKSFSTSSADPLKNLYNGEKMDTFWRFYMSCWSKYPQDMARAIMVCYFRYIHPFAVGANYYRAYIADCSPLGLDIHYRDTQLLKNIYYYAESWEKRPYSLLFLSAGFYSWILLYGFYRSRGKSRLVLLPLMVLFLGLFLTPINGEIRYALPVIMAAPLCITLGAGSVPAARRTRAGNALPAQTPGQEPSAPQAAEAAKASPAPAAASAAPKTVRPAPVSQARKKKNKKKKPRS